MRSAALLLLSLLAGPVAAWKTSDAAKVKQRFKDAEYNLIAFVNPEGASSKELLPEWKKAEKAKLSTLTIDCAQTYELCATFGVVSFPAIRLYKKDGSFVRYRGPRKSGPIISFTKRVLKPAVETLSKKNATAFTTSDDIVVVVNVKNQDDNLMSRVQTFAESHNDRYSFGRTRIDDEESSIRCYNNIDDTQHSSPDVNHSLALEYIVSVCAEPQVTEFTDKNDPKFYIDGYPLAIYADSDEAGRLAFANTIRPLAKTRNDMRFVILDSTKYPDLARRNGLANKKGLALRNMQSGLVYLYSDAAVQADKVESFLGAVAAGEVLAWDGSYPEQDVDSDGKGAGSGHDEL